MIEKTYNKLTKIGKWMDKNSLIHRTVDNINNDPECGWLFLTTVLLLGGFGVAMCLLWFYLLIEQGMPIGWIIFDTAIVIFCGWAVVKAIIPLSKEAYKQIDEKRKNQNDQSN